ncbi:MAG: elongation factor G [Planctomycetes bacterium]|nr:elongation factor G [Planctomycetota bacterium]
MTALDAIRNVSFVGHPSAGKTSLVDALAFLVGATARKGSVADKTSLVDIEPEEQEKGHTLQGGMVQAIKDGYFWTFIDTPGYPDFVSSANAAIFATDLTVGVISCTSGVTYNARKKLETAAAWKRGRAIVVTHVDDPNADFEAIVEDLRKKVGEVCVPVLFPNQSGSGFSKVTTVFESDANDWRRSLMDRVMDACADEALLNRYLETETLSEDELREHMPRAIQQGKLVPVLACNPLSGVGVDKLLDFIHDFAPHPDTAVTLDADGNPIQPDPNGALAGVAFNVKADPHVGKICVVRVLRGTLKAADPIIGPKSNDRGEKMGGLFRMTGKKRDTVEQAVPGEIVAFSKVEGVHYGEAFSRAGTPLVRFPMPPQPEPMVALAVVPKARGDEQKIGEALHKLAAEDPTFKSEFNSLTHELVVRGMSDLHLQVMEQRLKRRYGVEVTTHLPRIHYKETITRAAEGHYRHKKQSGGRGQFGECYVRVKPLAKGSGVVFTDSIVGGSIPRNLIPAVEKGMRDMVAKGVLTHSEVVDLDFEVYDGKFHEVDSDEASFKIAGARAFMDAFKKAHPVLLEPVMELVITVPTEAAGSIFSDLTSHRRGQVIDQWNEADGALTIIKALAPLSTVQTYQRELKSQTAGEGSFTMTLHDYSAVPANEQQKILAQFGHKHEEE